MNLWAGIAINLVVPLLGAIVFGLFCRSMLQARVQSPPLFSYFILFATFGGWLVVALTVLFWEWSGMASLGVLGLMLVAPFVTAGVAFNLRKRRELSGFHRNAYAISIAYSALTFLTLASLVLFRFLIQRPN
jgi:hypothetical protein